MLTWSDSGITSSDPDRSTLADFTSPCAPIAASTSKASDTIDAMKPAEQGMSYWPAGVLTTDPTDVEQSRMYAHLVDLQLTAPASTNVEALDTQTMANLAACVASLAAAVGSLSTTAANLISATSDSWPRPETTVSGAASPTTTMSSLAESKDKIETILAHTTKIVSLQETVEQMDAAVNYLMAVAVHNGVIARDTVSDLASSVSTMHENQAEALATHTATIAALVSHHETHLVKIAAEHGTVDALKASIHDLSGTHPQESDQQTQSFTHGATSDDLFAERAQIPSQAENTNVSAMQSPIKHGTTSQNLNIRIAFEGARGPKPKLQAEAQVEAWRHGPSTATPVPPSRLVTSAQLAVIVTLNKICRGRGSQSRTLYETALMRKKKLFATVLGSERVAAAEREVVLRNEKAYLLAEKNQLITEKERLIVKKELLVAKLNAQQTAASEREAALINKKERLVNVLAGERAAAAEREAALTREKATAEAENQRLVT